MANFIYKLVTILILLNISKSQNGFDVLNVKRVYICRGNETILNVPDNYTLVVVNALYGVTQDHSCKSINPQNCKTPFTVFCESTTTCNVSLLTDVTLTKCNNQTADYIHLEYRFLPLYDKSPNITMCSEEVIKHIDHDYGIITSVNYPNFSPGSDCSLQIFAPKGTLIRTYLIDIKTKPPEPGNELSGCTAGILEISSDCDGVGYCSAKTQNGSYEFVSCSNHIALNYLSYDIVQAFSLFYEVIPEEYPLLEHTETICSNEFLGCKHTSESKYTPMLGHGFYGVNNDSLCLYNESDCTGLQYFVEECFSKPYALPEIYNPNSVIIPNCHKMANYLYIRYKCVPEESTTIPEYNICDETLSDITDLRGFISSPSYPHFNQVVNECQQRIVAPPNKTINIWFVHIGTELTETMSTYCKQGFVEVTDINGTYTYCGFGKVSLENKLCSSVVYVSYRSPFDIDDVSEDLGINGFRLYFEVTDRNPGCPVGTPSSPSTVTRTTTTPQVVFDLEAFEEDILIICESDDWTINIPTGFLLFIAEANYGVTENGSCTTINPQNCKIPMNLTCSVKESCYVSLKEKLLLENCGNRYASYIEIKYRFIPLVSIQNRSICYESEINGTASPYGLITSPNYPNWEPNINCETSIIASEGKYIRLFLNDIRFEPRDSNGNCNNGYLKVKSDCDTSIYCGNKTAEESYIFTSCSNIISISYVSTLSNQNWSGFHLYYDVIEPEVTSDVYIQEFCLKDTADINIICPKSYSTRFTPFILNLIYSVSNNDTGSCKFNNEDCHIEIPNPNYCNVATSINCNFYSQQESTVQNCNNNAQNIQMSYRCVPFESTQIQNYEICDNSLQQITSMKGFLSSPNYRIYAFVSNECTQKIYVPNGYVINIWLFVNNAQSTCTNNYVKISDTKQNYTFCGSQKHSLEKTFFSSVYVSYSASVNSTTGYSNGFRLYFQIEKNKIQTTSITPSTTTKITISASSDSTTTSTEAQTKTTTAALSSNKTETTTTTAASSSNKTQTTTTTTTTTKPTSKYATILNDNIKTKNSKAAISWSLGVGIPVIAIIAIVLFFSFKKARQKSEENIEFTRIPENTSNSFKNLNFE